MATLIFRSAMFRSSPENPLNGARRILDGGTFVRRVLIASSTAASTARSSHVVLICVGTLILRAVVVSLWDNSICEARIVIDAVDHPLGHDFGEEAFELGQV